MPDGKIASQDFNAAKPTQSDIVVLVALILYGAARRYIELDDAFLLKLFSTQSGVSASFTCRVPSSCKRCRNAFRHAVRSGAFFSTAATRSAAAVAPYPTTARLHNNAPAWGQTSILCCWRKPRLWEWFASSNHVYSGVVILAVGLRSCESFCREIESGMYQR